MRISTSMIYELGVSSMQKQQQELVKLQQQISSGRRMLTPSDDPVAAAAVLDVSQSQGVNDQYKLNGNEAMSQLGLEESALADLTTVLQNVKTLAVYAGNPTLSDADRGSVAVELESNYQQLLAIANRDDGNGKYLFAGYQGATRPFTQVTPGNVTYNGDAGQRMVQIGAGRAIAVNDTGESVFRSAHNGNGTFVTAAGVSNGGTGLLGPAALVDPSKWNNAANSGNFTIQFHVSAGVTTYDVVDTINNVSMLTGAAPTVGPFLRPYVPGGAIRLGTQSPPDTNPTPFDFGATMSVGGAPSNGDTFTVARSTNQDLFTTVQNLITNLRNGSGNSAASRTAYDNSLTASLSDVDNALDSALAVRTSVGARMLEIDAAQSTSDNLSVQYTATLSGLQDLDYAKAISDLSLQQTFLQAAQQSFLRVTSLDLFRLL